MANMPFSEWLQSRLTAHGFTCGLIDGIIGPKTIRALKAFQKRRGLPVTGKSDEATVTALRTQSSQVSPTVRSMLPDRDQDAAEDGSKTVWPRQREVLGFFGNVGQNQTRVEVPWDMRLAWDTGVTVKRITLHEKVAPSAVRVFDVVRRLYSDREIKDLGLDLFGGSLNVRRMRGGSRFSMHSWGIAIDFDPIRNQLSWKRPKARLSHEDAVPFWEAWEAEGWVSLGRARNFDWMHIQAANL